jgi:hypothetical protein
LAHGKMLQNIEKCAAYLVTSARKKFFTDAKVIHKRNGLTAALHADTMQRIFLAQKARSRGASGKAVALAGAACYKAKKRRME